jgi:hypothetical protein
MKATIFASSEYDLGELLMTIRATVREIKNATNVHEKSIKNAF